MLFMITCVRMNTLKIRFWFFCQRWKNRAARWRRARSRKIARPRLEQLRLPFD